MTSTLESMREERSKRSVADLLEANRSAEGTILLEMLGVTIALPSHNLVEGVDLRVREGRVTALVGASGSGKSLSARAAMGVLDVYPIGLIEGSLRFPEVSDKDWFEGVRKAGYRAQRRCLRETAKLRGGYVTYSPQSASSALNPGRTVGQQLAMAINRRDKVPANMGAAIKDVLDEVGLPGRASRALVQELSGGQAQRAALAIAIAPNPKIMIADEPETGLDPVLRRVVTELMIDVARNHNVGLVLITHNKDTVDRIADDMVIIGPDPWAKYRERS